MRQLFSLALITLVSNLLISQQWMRSLPIAQDLAMVQNKMVLMVWEDTTDYAYPILINDDKGRTVFIRDLFTDENVSPIIWEFFIPVIVSEDKYGELYSKIKGKQSQSYIDKFNDDSIKIMDVNGYILNVTPSFQEVENITTLIEKYALKTSFLDSELRNFHNKQSHYNAYYLASKYLDFAMYTKPDVRPELVKLSKVYMNESSRLLERSNSNEKIVVNQRLDLLDAQSDLVSRKPRMAIRKLKRIMKDGIQEANESNLAFLCFTANICLGRVEEAQSWKSKVSSLNLKKSQMIFNLNN